MDFPVVIYDQKSCVCRTLNWLSCHNHKVTSQFSSRLSERWAPTRQREVILTWSAWWQSRRQVRELSLQVASGLKDRHQELPTDALVYPCHQGQATES